MLRVPFKAMSILMVSVIVEDAAVVAMLPPRMILVPEMLNAAVLPVEPSLVKLIPATFVVPDVRLLIVDVRVSPVKVMPPASDQFGATFESQLAGEVQLLFVPPPSQICPAYTEDVARVNGMTARSRIFGLAFMEGWFLGRLENFYRRAWSSWRALRQTEND